MGITVHYSQKPNTKISDEEAENCLNKIEEIAIESGMDVRHKGEEIISRDIYDCSKKLICKKGKLVKTLIVMPHHESETAEFTFVDGELMSISNNGNDYWGSRTCFCKTQFCGVEGHLQLCKLLMMLSNFIELEVYDEGNFWNKWDVKVLAGNLGDNQAMIDNLGKQLTRMYGEDNVIKGGKL